MKVSADEVEAAIAMAVEHRHTHVLWRAARRRGDVSGPEAGDLAHHEWAIARYDLILRVLRSYRRRLR